MTPFVEGSGDTRVLVLHGWALDSAVWAATRLETDLHRFTYAFVDFSGYGPNQSEAGRSADGIDGMATQALAAADELGWKSFTVLGHSMGGAAALRLATMAPDRVSSVVALTPVSPFGTPFDEETYKGFESAYSNPGPTLGGLAPHLTDSQLQNIVSRSQMVLDRDVWETYLANWSNSAFGGELPRYSGQVVLAYGASDPFVTKEYLQATADALPHASMIAIENAGHYPMVEQPVQTVRLWEDAITHNQK